MDAEQRLRLAGWLSDATGTAVEIAGATRITTGHSHEMWIVDLDHDRHRIDGRRRLVVRLEQGVELGHGGMFSTDVVAEARWIAALHAAGVPTPEVIAVDAVGEALGRPMVVLEYVDGIGDGALPAPVVDDLVRVVAAMHEESGAGRNAGLSDGSQVDHWMGVARQIERIPLLEEAAAWLVENRPAAARDDAPIHGDLGPGNLLHDGARILALTDWEFAHLGDPAEDWVYLATVRGRHDRTIDGWRTRIAELVGWSVDDDEWRYWETLNHFKGVCMNLTATPIFESGAAATPDMLTVGTALHHHFLALVVDRIHPKGPGRAVAPEGGDARS